MKYETLDGKIILAASNNAGIDCDTDKISKWTCSLKIYETLNIREGNVDNDPDEFVKDVINGTTFFIWTIIVISLVISGIIFVTAGADQWKASAWKTWIKNSIIGLLLVLFSYAIIKLIQTFVQG